MKNIFKPKKEVGSEINMSSSQVRVIIKRVTGRLPVTIATFMATQKRDEVKNMILVSEENNFKEDMNLTRLNIISSLETALELDSMETATKITKLKSRVEIQNKIVRNIKEGYCSIAKSGEEIAEKKDCRKVNIIDEENNLKVYKLLLHHVTRFGEGSYEEIVDGYRQVMFKFQEGVFYPYYHQDNDVTIYADMTTKRKIYKQEQDLIDLDYLNENKHFMSGWKGITVLVFCILFLMVDIFGFVKLINAWDAFDKSNIQEMLDKAEGSALNCAYYYATIGEETANFITAANNILNKTPETNSRVVDLR